MVLVDEVAKSHALSKLVMPESLHLPISARNQGAIENYVGSIVRELSAPNTNRAFLVYVPTPTSINKKLAVWDIPESTILHRNRQVWVHVDYRAYRRAYSKAFPNEDISLMVIDHIPNRKIAKVMGFNYVRVVPISRSANSSSGALAEKWGIKYQSTPHMRKVNREQNSFIQYADLSCLIKMLNICAGGGVMDIVNEGQKLLLEKRTL